MGFAETKRLLRTFRIKPNKLLGQNFMVEPELFVKMAEYAALGNEDAVLDAGAGFGFLTRFLAGKAKAVVAVEKDPRVASVLRAQVKGYSNVTVVVGDVLQASLPEFSKVVSIPPYYLSSQLLVWLLRRRVCSVLILQKEFVDRLVAPVGSEAYGWLTVLACYWARVEAFDRVPRSFFYPQPEVDSVVVRLTPWEKPPFRVKDEASFERVVRWLFTQRNRKLTKALESLAKTDVAVSKENLEKARCVIRFREKRVRELTPDDFGELANALRT